MVAPEGAPGWLSLHQLPERVMSPSVFGLVFTHLQHACLGKTDLRVTALVLRTRATTTLAQAADLTIPWDLSGHRPSSVRPGLYGIFAMVEVYGRTCNSAPPFTPMVP